MDSIYGLLCNYGFSPAKSAEIALDAKRGFPEARMMVAEVGGELDTMPLMPTTAQGDER